MSQHLKISIFVIVMCWMSLLFCLNLPPSPLRSKFNSLAMMPHLLGFEASGWRMYARPGSFDNTPMSRFVYHYSDGSKSEWITLPLRQGFKKSAWRLLTFRILKRQIPTKIVNGFYQYWCTNDANITRIEHHAVWIPIAEHIANRLAPPAQIPWFTVSSYNCKKSPI